MAQHISLRVPWHDSGWKGVVCRSPKENQACLRLKNIYQNRDAALEEELSSCKLTELDCLDHLPCLREGGSFMCPDKLSITVEHPYTKYYIETHGHLKPTKEIMPPYSYPARPFRWTMKNRLMRLGEYTGIEDLALEKGIDYHPEYEPDMKTKTWVQDGRNQRAIFDTFFQDVRPDESLCVFYAKQAPFVEDSRRVVIGIGHVKAVNPSVKYDSDNPRGMTSYTWETMIQHSIRDTMEDGFLLPYDQLTAYAEKHSEFDMGSATVFAAEDFFDEFSYASEHISYDAVIDVILQCLNVLEIVKECGISGNWNQCIQWLNQQLSAVWEDRGAFPGLGAMLAAFGVPSGVVMARELKNQSENSEDLWKLLDRAMAEPEQYLSDFCCRQINKTIKSTWKNLPKTRKTLFQIMSRIYLSIDQAETIFRQELRHDKGIMVTDRQIMENPYLLYERTRNQAEELRISIKKVDTAFFPPKHIKNQYPIMPPSKIESENDPRRVRALAVSILENNALSGNTVMPVNNLVMQINKLPIEPSCPVNGDMIGGMNDFFTDEIVTGKDAAGKNYYKLVRYKEIGQAIKSQVNKRINSPNRHVVDVDWRERVDRVFGAFNPEDKDEEAAREEKTAALKILAESRLSVLIGGAGTGKTTVLSILCQEKKIQDGGILLLAPTGKARVRMSQGLRGKVKFTACTIAQFLVRSGRYNSETFTYTLEGKKREWRSEVSVPETVIIDESSMLTEDMFGALMKAVKAAGRIIFVGDTNQLPPIGAGRPFVDLVQYLRGKDKIPSFPNVGNSYAKLIVTRRQRPTQKVDNLRADVRLSKWYTEDSDILDEGIFAEIQSGVKDGTILFKQWKQKEDLEEMLFETIANVAGMEDVDDMEGFDRSLGGNVVTDGPYAGHTFFNKTSKDNLGCAKSAENWQILSPVRNNAQGVLNINYQIHDKYRAHYLSLAGCKVPNAMGAEGIVYGDKVINVLNLQRKAFPETGAENFIANGEIGMACSNYGKANTFKFLNVEFSSQIGYTYSYQEKDFSEEGTAPLELAYALTVHKAQGSQFDTVILVLSDNCFLLSKELLYTALTRQSQKLIILYNNEAYHLKKYSSMEYSDIARRFTDLFAPPKIVRVNQKYYEENLIHRTKNGVMVRSKSEVIIANMLCDNGIDDFLYEEKLYLGDTYKLPDFTIKDAASGTTIIWEHCGMLHNLEYRKRWEEKKRIYKQYGYTEEKGNLIVTRDDINGGLDSQIIQQKIDEYLL